MIFLKYLLLSHFDERMGPRIFLKMPENIDDEEFAQVPVLMDLYIGEEFFLHEFGGFKSANYLFEIQSQKARGDIETLLISILFPDFQLEESICKDLLSKFIEQFKKIKDVYLAFHEDREKFNELKDLFESFYKSIPEETTIVRRKSKRIFVFGLSKTGKTPLVEKIKEIISNRQQMENDINLSDLLTDELSIIKYEASGKVFNEFWSSKLKNLDALIFTIDISKKEQYNEARDLLHKVANLEGMQDLPILIIFNKGILTIDELIIMNRVLKISDLPQKDIKYFVATENFDEEIFNALSWLATRIAERNPIITDMRIGVLFALWYKDVGLQFLGIYPQDFFEDLQEIAIRLVNITKSVFAEGPFKKSFFILPLSNMNLKTAIFTDYAEDLNAPDGRYPIMLASFFEDKIPAEIITRFTDDFYKSLAKIKLYYSEGPLVEKDLKDLHETLNIKMFNMKGVLKDLIKAEHRYQSLFEVNRDAIVILDYKSGLIIDANKETEKILNRNLEDIVGIHPLEFLAPEEYNKFKNAVMQQITENIPPTIFELKLLNGKNIPVELLVGKVQVGGQNLIQVNFRDITERLKSEKALQESERRNRALLNSIPDNIMEIRKDGKIIYFKSPKELEKVLDPKEFIEKNIFEVLPKRIAQIVIDYIQRTMQTQNIQEFYFKLPIKNVEYKFEARMVPYGEESVIIISRVMYTK